MEEWLLASDAVINELGLKEIPDYSIINRTFKRFRVKLLEQLQRTLLDELQPRELRIIFDTTGYSPTQASYTIWPAVAASTTIFTKAAMQLGLRAS